MKLKLTILILLLGVLVLSSCQSTGQATGVASDLDQSSNERILANCLTEKGVKMYGAFWCPHCVNQKELFKDAKDLVPYVECTEEKEVCQREGISGYPTWKFSDGTSLSGPQSLTLLAKKSGCVY